MIYDHTSSLSRRTLLWLFLLVPLPFVSDILYGLMNYYSITLAVTPGIVLRGIILMVACVEILRYRTIIAKSFLFWLAVILVSITPAFCIAIIYGQNIFFDFVAFAKALYLPMVTGLIILLFRRFYMHYADILQFIEYSAYFLSVSLLLSQLLGLHKLTYGDYAFGTTGIFYAQNDLTLGLGLSMLAAGYRIVFVRFSIIRLALIALTAFACVRVGTRSSLVMVISVGLYIIICSLWGVVKKRGEGIRFIKKIFIILLILFLSGGAFWYGLSKQLEFGYQHRKIEQIREGVYPRQALVAAALQYIERRSAWLDFFGEGADSFQRGVARFYPTLNQRRMVEVDWLDYFGAYGLIFTLVIHCFVLIIFFGTVRKFVFKGEALFGLFAAALLVYIGHSFFAGHALSSPIPTTLAAVYFSGYFVLRE